MKQPKKSDEAHCTAGTIGRCSQCKNQYQKFTNGTITLDFFGKRFHFCSRVCHDVFAKWNCLAYLKYFEKKVKADPHHLAMYMSASVNHTGLTQSALAWFINDLKKIISREEAIALYKLQPPVLYNDKIERDYPKLWAYIEKFPEDIPTFVLNTALEAIGEIE